MQALLWQLCLLRDGSMPVPVNGEGRQLAGAELGRDAGARVLSGLAGLSIAPRAQTHISPHGCLAGAARCSGGGRLSELDSLLVSLPLLTPSPPMLEGAAGRAACPSGCMPLIKPAKVQ